MIFLYNLFFPLIFILFIPGILYKYIKRGGVKDSYAERFAFFSESKKKELASISGRRIWIHAVSVGETQLAIDFINEMRKSDPNYSFIISTTTTTGQELAQNKLKGIAAVIFCPIDYFILVQKVFDLVTPELLIIFETEIWPSMIYEAHRRKIKIAQVNSRISDHSFAGYKRFSFFISPFLSMLDVSCAQTDIDLQRLKTICPSLNVVRTGTMKFDQKVPEKLPEINLKEIFGEDEFLYLLAASTHPGEEKLIIEIYKNLIISFNNLRLIIVPRHAERGNEIVADLNSFGISYFRRSNKSSSGEKKVMCLLADTTGEMLAFMKASDIVIMGKCFAGNDGGHNVIEPALLGKPVITGRELSNFRFVMKIMIESKAIIGVSDSELENAIRNLLKNTEERKKLGEVAMATVSQHIGATKRTIAQIEKIINT